MSRNKLALAALLAVLPCGVVGAITIDGVVVSERVFNDFPLSTLTVTSDFPAEVRFQEGPYGTDFGGFANRHDAVFSSDGGATEQIFNRIDAFDVSTLLTLDAGFIAPRKEAGIRLNSNITGDGLFIVNTDAHEIVAFGGAFPFYSFNSGHGLSFDAGDTLQMRVIHRPGNPTPGSGPAGTIQYIVNVDGSYYSSPQLEITNLELGVLDGSRLGVYVQGGTDNAATDFVDARFANLVVSDPLTFLGDANGDGTISGADYTLWADGFGLTEGASIADGDFNNDQAVTGADYTIWADHFGETNGSPFASGPGVGHSVPEPVTLALGGLALAALGLLGWRRR